MPLASLASGVRSPPTFTLICLGLASALLATRDLQHALFIVRLDLVGVSGRRQRKRARKTSILPLDAAEVFSPFFPFEFPHATHGEYIILDPDIDVLLFNARNFDR